MARFFRRPGALSLPRPPRIGRLLAYALAILIPIAIATFQHYVVPHLNIAPFVLLYFGVTLTSWLGGPGPGVVAALISGPIGNYLFELEAHPGWPQGRSVRMTGSKPIRQSSGPDAAGPGLAHSFLMAQSPTLRRPRRPVPGTSSGTHAPTRWQSEIERQRQSLSCQVE